MLSFAQSCKLLSDRTEASIGCTAFFRDLMRDESDLAKEYMLRELSRRVRERESRDQAQ
jgi:hypothetical protein